MADETKVSIMTLRLAQNQLAAALMQYEREGSDKHQDELRGAIRRLQLIRDGLQGTSDWDPVLHLFSDTLILAAFWIAVPGPHIPEMFDKITIDVEAAKRAFADATKMKPETAH
jgi:hypothetical protein